MSDFTQAEEVDAEVSTAGTDPLATLIRGKYEDARQYRQQIELEWLGAEEAFNGNFEEVAEGEERRPYFNITRRQCSQAVAKIHQMLFGSTNAKIPFRVLPSRRPRFIPTDIHEMAGQMPQMSDKERTLYIEELKKHLPLQEILTQRCLNMENRIRDILSISRFTNEIENVLYELTLHGTGVLKSPVLEHRNYPVYSGQHRGRLEQLESAIESEILPTAKFVSLFDLYPAPEATKIEDATYIIERRLVSSVTARRLLTDGNGYDAKVVADVLERQAHGSDANLPDTRNPHHEGHGEQEREYELLEFWGWLDTEDTEGYLELPGMEVTEVHSVAITMLGDRVIKAVTNPYDGELPYKFCYWQRNTASIWGSGIHNAIRDIQSLLNFATRLYVEGKELSSVPMMAIDPTQFDDNTDFTRIHPGMMLKTIPGADIASAFKPVNIPDSSHGLMEMIQFLQREADLNTSQSPIGMGQSSKAETRTATGMSLLNSNQNRMTAAVVQSVSAMIRDAVNGIYRWLLTDSDDPELHADGEALVFGFERYVAQEVHSQQLLQLLQVLQGFPQIAENVKMDRLTKPVLAAFSLDPDDLAMNDMEKQEQAKAQQAQMQQMKQMEAEQKMQDAQIEEQLTRLKSALEERSSIGQQRRALEIQRILKLMETDPSIQPSDFSDLSIVLKEEQRKLQQQRQQQEMAEAEWTKGREQLIDEIAREQANAPVSSQPGGIGGGASMQTMEPLGGIPETPDPVGAGEGVEPSGGGGAYSAN